MIEYGTQTREAEAERGFVKRGYHRNRTLRTPEKTLKKDEKSVDKAEMM